MFGQNQTPEQVLSALTFGGAPVPWFHDLSGYTSDYGLNKLLANVAYMSWATAYEVTGASGWLTFARPAMWYSPVSILPMRITIDGTKVINIAASDYAVLSTGGPASLMHPIPFKSSLKIEVQQDKSASATSVECSYVVLRKTGNPKPTKVSLRDASTRKFAVYGTTSTSETTMLNVTGAGWLLYFAHGMTYPGGADGYIDIDGVRKMSDTGKASAVMFGPIRFTTSCKLSIRSTSSGGYSVYGQGLVILD